MKDGGALVNERYVEIALRILDYLGGFRDFDQRRLAVN
jgi:hypothetical protein